MQTPPGYPASRLRRLRATKPLRDLVREHEPNVLDLVMPLLVGPGRGVRSEIPHLPGSFQFSADTLLDEVTAARELGLRSFILFGTPANKDQEGRIALHERGIVQESLRDLRKTFKHDVVLFSDACFCDYATHGHCGQLAEHRGQKDVDTDKTLPMLVELCVSHARAGADVIVPSTVVDGMIAAIRAGLDAAGFPHVAILSCAARFASALDGGTVDRGTYQLDPGNAEEALREVALDVAEGADMLLVQPALPCLDVLQRVKSTFHRPTAAFHVGGEYAMVKAAAKNGWLDERRAVLEILTSLKRAGADMILTWHAKDAAGWLKARA